VPKAKTDRSALPGEVIRDYPGGKPKLIASGVRRWPRASEAVFLDTLATTCNVTRSAAAAGFSCQSAYRHRRRMPAFAERWREALEIGYERLEQAMLDAAIRSVSDEEDATEAPLPRMSIGEAMNLLRLHRSSVKEGVQRSGRPPREPSIEDVRASIARRLNAIERARGRS